MADKLIGGIASAVVIGIIMWYLTQQGGPLSQLISSPPHAKIISYSTIPDQPLLIPVFPKAKVAVYNDGGKTAENCRLIWDIEPCFAGWRMNEFGGFECSDATVSGLFGLPPGQTREITVESLKKLNDSGDHDTRLRLICDCSNCFDTKEIDWHIWVGTPPEEVRF